MKHLSRFYTMKSALLLLSLAACAAVAVPKMHDQPHVTNEQYQQPTSLADEDIAAYAAIPAPPGDMLIMSLDSNTTASAFDIIEQPRTAYHHEGFPDPLSAAATIGEPVQRVVHYFDDDDDIGATARSKQHYITTS